MKACEADFRGILLATQRLKRFIIENAKVLSLSRPTRGTSDNRTSDFVFLDLR